MTASHVRPGDDTPMRRETLDRMRGNGVGVFGSGVIRLKAGVDIAAFEPVREIAAVLGARNAVVNGDDPDAGRTADLLRRLCGLGRKRGGIMHPEPVGCSGCRGWRRRARHVPVRSANAPSRGPRRRPTAAQRRQPSIRDTARAGRAARYRPMRWW